MGRFKLQAACEVDINLRSDYNDHRINKGRIQYMGVFPVFMGVLIIYCVLLDFYKEIRYNLR